MGRLFAILFAALAGLPGAWGETTAGERIQLSLVVEPSGWARAAQSGLTPDGLADAAAKAGIRRILVSLTPLRPEDGAAVARWSPEALLRAARSRGLEAWAVQPLFGPLDRLSADSLAAPRGKGKPLGGVPCYALPQARAALRRAVERCLKLPADGILLLAGGPVAWPEGNAVARELGYNDAVVAEYRKRYGSDPREAKPESAAALFFVRLKGEYLGAAIRESAAAARAAGRRVALALPLSEANVPSARHAYVDAEGLIRDGTLDEVALVGERRFNTYRWKTQRYPSPGVSLWLEVAPDGKGLRAAVTAALDNPTADGLILDALPALAAGGWPGIPAAIEAWKEQRAEEERFAAALASGEYRVTAGVAEARASDQATLHGVGQSFTLDQPGQVAAVRLLLALRPSGAGETADLRVELRADRDGTPRGEVLATAVLRAYAVVPEPSYRWATARFPQPVALDAGKRTWISLPDAPEYVCRMDKSASYPGGNAWSSRYDYTRADWVFEIVALRNGVTHP